VSDLHTRNNQAPDERTVPSRSRNRRKKLDAMDREERKHKASRKRWNAAFRYPFGLLTVIDLIETRTRKDGHE